MKVLVAGSSGLVGSGLVPALRNHGHEVVRLVRRETSAKDEARWDPKGGVLAPEVLDGVDAVVNLAGAGIGDKPWTPERRAEIIGSRTSTTGLLARTMASRPEGDRPSVFVQGSAVGWYGVDDGTPHREGDPNGDGFLAEVVDRWEAAAGPAAEAGIRTVLARTGIVLSTAGGALKKQLLPFRLGLGGRLGSGRQYLSWIHLADEVGALVFCLEEPSMRGPVNLTAPTPVTNAEFTKALGRAVHRPTLLPVPTPALRLVFGRALVDEVLLGGQRVEPAKLVRAGYRFRHPDLASALADLL